MTESNIEEDKNPAFKMYCEECTRIGFTRSLNILDDLWMRKLSPEEYLILRIIVRKTYGFRKDEDAISLSQFEEYSGLSRKTVIKCINRLVNKKLIIKRNSTVRGLRGISVFRVKLLGLIEECKPLRINDREKTEWCTRSTNLSGGFALDNSGGHTHTNPVPEKKKRKPPQAPIDNRHWKSRFLERHPEAADFSQEIEDRIGRSVQKICDPYRFAEAQYLKFKESEAVEKESIEVKREVEELCSSMKHSSLSLDETSGGKICVWRSSPRFEKIYAIPSSRGELLILKICLENLGFVDMRLKEDRIHGNG